MSIYEWMKNPLPKFGYPMCSYCLFETSCADCQGAMLRSLGVYEMYRIENWIFDDIMGREDEEEEVDDDSIIDDVDSILEGEEGVKEKVDKKGNRKKVRKGQRKSKKEVHDGRERTTKRKGKKVVASDA